MERRWCSISPILNGAQTGLYLYGHRVYTYACTSTLYRIRVYTHACYVSWLLTYGRVTMDTCMQRDLRLQRSIFNLFQSYVRMKFIVLVALVAANVLNIRPGENSLSSLELKEWQIQTFVFLNIFGTMCSASRKNRYSL